MGLVNSLPIKYPQLQRDHNKPNFNRRDKPHSKSVHKRFLKQMTNQKEKKLYQKKTPNTLSPSVKLQYHSSSGIHLWIYIHTDQDTYKTREYINNYQNTITNNI